MKLFYLLLMVFCFTYHADAQIVNIPDPNFKALLISIGIDTNGDGQIQQTEAEAVTGQLDVSAASYAPYISDLTGINAFVNVHSLNMYGLWALNAVNLNNLPNLTKIEILSSVFSNFSFTGPNNVVELTMENSGLTSLNFLNTFSKLEKLRLQNLNIADVTISNLSKLKEINMGPPYLYQNTNISNLPELALLVNTFADGNLTLTNLPKLESYYGFVSAVYNLSLNQLPKLTRFISGNFRNDTADFGNCPSLSKLSFDNDYIKLKYLNIKNAAVLDSFYVYYATSADSLKVCVDEGEAQYVQNRLTQQGFNPNKIMVSPFCSFTEGGTYNTIKGIVRFDGNANGCDAGDAGMKQLNLSFTEAVAGTFVRSTDSAGNYAHYAGKGTYTVTPQFANPYFIITPPSASVYFDSANSYTTTQDFCITANGVKHDLEVALLPTWQPARPGFNAGYALLYKNNGNTTQSGTLQLNYNAAKLNFVNESTGGATQSAGQLYWNFANIKPFESRTINITLSILPPAANNIGDTLLFNAVVASANTDETPVNNTTNIKQPVQGSFDPNDKQCLEGNSVAATDLANNMHYQIRFQNEGNDTAFNIVVADTLSANYDAASFQLLGSSHPCTIKRKGNVIQFNFENIRLPYKIINEPASHGYLSFTVKPKNTLVAGDSLNNRASIYFDFNAPVVTNKSVALVSAAAALPVKFEYFNGQTDGNSNKINWKMNCSGTGAVTMYIERSSNGVNFETIKVITSSAAGCMQPFTYTDNNVTLYKNYYRIKVVEEYGRMYYSGAVLLQQKNTGFSIVSVTSGADDLRVTFTAPVKKDFVLSLCGADGRLLSQKTITVYAGTTTINLPAHRIASGVYVLSVKGGGEFYSIKQFINTGQQ